MRIAPWRLALTGGAVVILAVAGIGLAQAATPTPATTTPAAPAAAPASPDPAGAAGLRILRSRIGWRALVHADITLDRPAKGLVSVVLDHGTIGAVGTGTLTVDEAGGSSVTIATSDATKVRVDGKAATLADLEAGDQVYVVRLPAGASGSSTAALIVVPPVRSDAGTNGTSGSGSSNG